MIPEFHNLPHLLFYRMFGELGEMRARILVSGNSNWD